MKCVFESPSLVLLIMVGRLPLVQSKSRKSGCVITCNYVLHEDRAADKFYFHLLNKNLAGIIRRSLPSAVKPVCSQSATHPHQYEALVSDWKQDWSVSTCHWINLVLINMHRPNSYESGCYGNSMLTRRHLSPARFTCPSGEARLVKVNRNVSQEVWTISSVEL